MNRVAAFDCGGSRTRVLVVAEGDQVVARLERPGVNVTTHGTELLAGLVQRCLRNLPEVEGVVLSLAGVRTDAERARVLATLRAYGVEQPVAVLADAEAILRAADLRHGIALIAGTGSVVYARDDLGAAHWHGGWGSVLGDEGSGYWVGRRALQEIVRSDDEGTAGAANLSRAALENLGLEDIGQLRSVVASRDAVARVASLAPAIGRLADGGDALAGLLVQEAACELARLVRLVLKRGAFEVAPPVVCSGGAFDALPMLFEHLTGEVGAAATLSRLSAEPVWGAYWLARDDGVWDRSAASGTGLTEAINPDTVDLDELSTRDLLTVMNAQDQRVALAVAGALDDLASLVDETARRVRAGGRLIYVGAGTSGRLAMLDAVECVPTFGLEPGIVLALVAGGRAALSASVEGAEDDGEAGRADIAAAAVGNNDTVLGISASGGADYVRGALEESGRRGAFTALLTCNPGAPLLSVVSLRIVVVVGPEVIAGSSRLKAGTAQKLVLNMLSTAVMVRLGRTIGNRMLGVQPTNAKLRRRAVGLVASLGEVAERDAERALAQTGWDVGRAALLLKLGDLPAVERSIAEHGGVRSALLALGLDEDASS